MNLVAQGGATDLTNLAQYEEAFNEGDRGVLHLETVVPIPDPDGVRSFLSDQLTARGVTLYGDGVTASGSTIEINFQKGIAPLVIIAIAIAAVIVIVAIVVLWKLYNAGQSVETAASSFWLGMGAMPWIIGLGALALVIVLAFKYKPRWW
jgi:hypothetical protein